MDRTRFLRSGSSPSRLYCPLAGGRRLALLLLASTCSLLARADDIDFARDVRPLLADRCFACHGPDGNHRKAGLRLDVKEGVLARGRRGAAVVPGEPDASLLWQRVTSADPEERMPPAESGKTLAPPEREILRRWIEAGAPWQAHWAFDPPRATPLPRVQNTSWPRNPIDTFILARLEREGLAPADEADRATLARRVALDLTGLPPDPELVAEFLAETADGAYERYVDRLLGSPRYGEHLARYWLDAARYGDTHGLHLDNRRIIWPYRDWVIRAFNENLPFDRFTVEQLAGDLLESPTLEQRVATGFNRCNVTTSEGGAIDEEFYVRYAVDRVETTSTVWLGMTAGCAVCHDHKFDPLSQREFYSLFAFFNNIQEPAMDGNQEAVPPVVRVPLPGVTENLARVRAERQTIDAELASRVEKTRAEFETWLPTAAAEPLEEPGGLVAYWPLDDTVSNIVGGGRTGEVSGDPVFVPGKHLNAFRVDNSFATLGDQGDFESDQAFSYGAWIRTEGKVTGSPIARMDPATGHRGWDLYVVGRKVAMHLIHEWPQKALKVTSTEDVLEPNRWQHVFITYDGSRKAAGVKIFVDGVERAHKPDHDALDESSCRTKVPLKLGERNSGGRFQGGEIDDVRIYDRRLEPTEVEFLAGADPIRRLLAKPAAERSDEDLRTLHAHWLGEHDEEYRNARARDAALAAEEKRLENSTVTTLVMEERETPRGAWVLHRGEYDQRREPVEPGTPSVLPPFPSDQPRNRLGFARWLVDPGHPLTARVAVNRYWQQKFGIGLVKTTEDFGSQGEPPSHPALLDWLALEFVRSGWDIRHMQRLLVTSATYRQSSKMRPELLSRDPENRLLARGPRYRLEAEPLRDQALALSGLLVDTIGGPSVKPPQPAGLWYAVGYTSSNTARFAPDSGDAIYRRSFYTFWKRTSPPPVMATFDAPSRESCTVRRERTNTPLQALALLNERQFFECARRFAERAMKTAGDSDEARATWLFSRATLRAPDADDLRDLLAVRRQALATYGANPESARRVVRVGDSAPDESLDAVELASWTLVANVVLNLDEVLCKN